MVGEAIPGPAAGAVGDELFDWPDRLSARFVAVDHAGWRRQDIG